MQLEVDCMYIFPLSLLFFCSINRSGFVVHSFLRSTCWLLLFIQSNPRHSFTRSFIHSFIQHGSKKLFFLSSLLPSAISLIQPHSHPPPPKIYHRILNHLATIPQPHNPMLRLLLLLLMIMLLSSKNQPPLWTFLRQSPSHNTQS